MGKDLWSKLMDMLDHSSAYDAQQVDAARKQGVQNLDDQRRMAEDRAKADAANRGVYYGSPLTTSLGDINSQFLRGQSDLETNLIRDQAQRQQQDRMSAIQAILQYGQQQQNGQAMDNDLWFKLMQLGYGGYPQLPNPSGTVPYAGMTN
jgi:hypothetical protein